ncbi:MAG TPA: hypothetical protein VIW29_01710, partial [Polyangiaceae bacterium]
MRALEELLNSWRSNPDADATIAVCSFLGGSKQDELIREVGASAETWHSGDPAVMLAVGRMYLDANMLQEAQTSLVAAGKADARDPRAFRFLGEVLLRRGDALRADKVLTRALQLGASSDDVELWHERAVLYSALQKRVGAEAVAAEVARSMPRQASVPPPSGSDPLPAFNLDETTSRRMEASKPAVAVSRKPTLLGLAESSPLPRFDSADPLSQSADPIRLSDADLEAETSNPSKVLLGAPRGGLPAPVAARPPLQDAPAPLANSFLSRASSGVAAAKTAATA